MNNNKKLTQKGFTIIEVLIVLAIAAVIMLIVLLAVPALQRNNRNTTLKSDVAAVLGGVSEFQTNNNGIMPTSAPQTGNAVVFTGPAGTNTVTVNVQGATVVNTAGTAPAAGVTGTLSISFNHQCNGNTQAAGTQQRSSIVLYNIEQGGGNTVAQCQGS